MRLCLELHSGTRRRQNIQPEFFRNLHPVRVVPCWLRVFADGHQRAGRCSVQFARQWITSLAQTRFWGLIMSDETANRSAGASDGGRPASGGDGLGSPLQTRAAFLKNWDWLVVVRINRGACERSRAQHGLNSETSAACAADWEKLRVETLTLAETLDRLRAYHRRAPFLFFNGNTFATIGRELALALFSDLAPSRKREVSSIIAHYIAGVLDRESMTILVEGLCEEADFKSGDRVKTLRGSMHGSILRVLPDGRVLWRADSGAELTGLPESLIREQKP